MPFISIRNQKVFYARQGQAVAGQPHVVLIHGAAGSHLDWPPQLRRIAGAMVYALDLPGHGRSARPGQISIEGYANFVAEFIAALGMEKVILVGHSMGGAIAQTLGLRQAAGLVGLVLIGTGARLRVAPQFIDGVFDDFTGLADQLMGYYWSADVPTEIRELSERLWLQNDPAVVHGDFLACDRFDVRPQLNAITLPTLVIGSTQDRMTPLKFSQYLVDHLPDSHLVTIDGSGHMLAAENPEAVASAVQLFVDRFGPPP